MLIQECQFLFHIHISIQINIAVGWMVISSVEIQEILIGKIRNIFRITAWFTSISGIREKVIHNLPFQNFIRWGESTFHLIIYNTVIFQRSFLLFQMIVPAFLTENLFSFIDIRIKYRIQINMHQILKILIIAAGYRIAGFIRISHGIQERIQRTLYQFYERILRREILRSTQYGMFHDMWYSGTVWRRCTESDIEYLVVIIIFYQ